VTRKGTIACNLYDSEFTMWLG